MAQRTALLWAYDLDEPSFRHRILPLVPELEGRGWTCTVEALPKGRYLRRILERRARVGAADLLLLHRIKTTPLELWPLRRAARRIVYDVDDAVYYRRPRRLGDEPDRSWTRRWKFARTCAAADLVLAGNRTLAAIAARSAARVEVVPTAVDLARYEQSSASRTAPRTLAWIGLPENLVYLELIRPALARLARDYPDVRLRVVSSRFPTWPEVDVEEVRWSADSEIDTLRSAGIGVMPLTDDDWTRGKCAFKLIQYMAAGLPCVGSAVGANLDVVDDRVTGFLAADSEGWTRALRTLLDDPDRAEAMGQAGQKRVREHYDVRVVAPRVADLLEEIVNQQPRSLQQG